MGLGAILLAAVAAAAAASSSVVLVAVLVTVVVVLTEVLVELRLTQTNSKLLEIRLSNLERSQENLVLAWHTAQEDGPGTSPLPADLAIDAARALLRRGHVLDAYGVLAATRSLSDVDAPIVRELRNELRRRGYLTMAQSVARLLLEAAGSDLQDRTAARLIDGEIAVLSGAFVPAVQFDLRAYSPRPRRVLHVVGNSLPYTQSGYTLRTHYTAIAQRDSGLDPQVVTQTGYCVDGVAYASEDVDGITYHRIAGPARGSKPFDIWLREHVENVANVVRSVRPEVLHASSDFVNALTALAVGREFRIPVIYESRGFWEETWLSQQARAFGWHDLARLEASHGLPDAYVWRRAIEDHCRRSADRVVTLSDVMADRIAIGGVPRDRIAVMPNGVDVDAFPVVSRNARLARRLRVTAGTTVIGCISSIVEYEGIDTLVAAYAIAKASSPTPLALLVVGDGPELPSLKRQANELGVADAIFTGRVPHDAVLDYYSMIDIFVVPRKPVEVCDLVTPLKPFEAFSTGRAVVLSNVRALVSIAEQSGAAELFVAGDQNSLADVLIALATHKERRRELANAGAAWVRAASTWAANATAYTRLYQGLLAK